MTTSVLPSQFVTERRRQTEDERKLHMPTASDKTGYIEAPQLSKFAQICGISPRRAIVWYGSRLNYTWYNMLWANSHAKFISDRGCDGCRNSKLANMVNISDFRCFVDGFFRPGWAIVHTDQGETIWNLARYNTPWVHSFMPNLALIGDWVWYRRPQTWKFSKNCCFGGFAAVLLYKSSWNCSCSAMFMVSSW